MKMTLKALVQGALSEADQQLKLASAQDAAPANTNESIKLALEGMTEEEQKKEEKKEEKKGNGEDKKNGEKEEEKTSGVSLADHAMKLAQAVDHIGSMWTKLAQEGSATSHLDAPGPDVMAGQHNVGDTTKHTATTPATVPAAVASHGGGGTEQTDGKPAGIETNKKDFTTPEWTGNPEAQKGAIRVSGVHPGEGTKAAADVLASQQALLGKVAQDPSSPQPTGISTTTDPGKLDMVPAASAAIPDNAGMASMTKRTAKTQFVKDDAAKLVREPAFSAATDKAITDNLAQGTETAKISSVKAGAARALLKKVASAASDPNAAPHLRVKVAKFQQALSRINQKRQTG